MRQFSAYSNQVLKISKNQGDSAYNLQTPVVTWCPPVCSLNTSIRSWSCMPRSAGVAVSSILLPKYSIQRSHKCQVNENQSQLTIDGLQCWKKFIAAKNSENLEAYKRTRNTYNVAIKEAKARYEKNVIDSLGSSRSKWQFMAV